MKKVSSYLFSADVVRVVAILGAVSIHVLQPVYNRLDFVGGVSWWVADIWNAFSRTSIPLFIMLSGYLLLNKNESKSETYHRTFHRIFIPFLCWFCIYVGWDIFNNGWSHFNPLVLLIGLISGHVFHLYFLVIMIGLYLITPALRSLKNKSTWFQWIVMITALFLGLAATVFQYFVRNPVLNFFLVNSFTLFSFYVGFFISGYVLGNWRVTFQQKMMCMGIFILSLCVTAYLSYKSFMWIQQGVSFIFPADVLSPYFDHYLSPNVVLMSLTGFCFLFHQSYKKFQNNTFLSQLIKNLARSSFGIFLVHLIVIDVLDHQLHLNIDAMHYPLVPYLVVKFVTVVFVSWGITVIIQKTPSRKFLLGEK
jgi:surface polysaccharide O-acyltransferase-like enzyme